jgi:hypothetical protein
MWFGKKLFEIRSFLGIHWFLNRRLFFWIGMFMLAGAVIGIITFFNPGVNAQQISRNLIDGNILNCITVIPRASFGRFIAVRLIEFLMIATFIFILCQTRVTALFVFPYIAFRASIYVINLYWIIARLGMFGGVVLFVFYLIFFIQLMILLAMLVVFIMKQCAVIRSYGFRRGICWRNYFKVMLVFAGFITFIAVLEWLSFWLIFSKILWPVVFPI